MDTTIETKSQTESDLKGSTLRTRRYRSRIKNNVEKLKEVREKDRLRKNLDRKDISYKVKKDESLLAEKRKKKREEMKRYRDKKKAETSGKKLTNSKRSHSMKTTKQKGKKRERNSSTYILRKVETMKKKIAVDRTKAWRLRVQLKDTKKVKKVSDSSKCFSSYHSEYRAVKRVKEVLPVTPEKKARILEKVMTPNTTVIFQNSQLSNVVIESMKNTIKEVKPRGGSSKNFLIAYKTLKSTLSQTPISKGSKLRGLMRKYFDFKRGIPQKRGSLLLDENKRKRRKDRISDSVRDKIKNFFISPEISREVPLKREVMKIKNETGSTEIVQKNIMTMSLEEAYGTFKAKFPDIKIGLTTFKSLKPKNVKKVSETSRRTCLCTLCSNVALKVECIRKLSLHHIQEKFDTSNEMKNLTTITKSDLSFHSLCKYDEEYPHMSCLQRKCQSCGKASDFLKPLQAIKDKTVNWCHWEYINVKKGTENKKLMSCVEKSTKISNFLEAVDDEMKAYPLHMFRANWQHRQMSLNQKYLKEGEVQLVMDFSENYRCAFKDEVQSGYFDQAQVTIHPMMAYYLKNGLLVKHVIVGISHDPRHDAHLVKKFESEALKLVSKNIDIKTVFEWTDGCAAQYKGKIAFADISINKNMFIVRNFFETSHGKGVCDGIGAVVKNICFRAVVTGKAILGNAEMVYNFCKGKLAHGPEIKPKTPDEMSIWDIIFSQEVSHSRTEVNVSTLKGTRQLQSIRNMFTPYKVAIRTLSCFCEGCLTEKKCLNTEWVDTWTDKELKVLK